MSRPSTSSVEFFEGAFPRGPSSISSSSTEEALPTERAPQFADDDEFDDDEEFEADDSPRSSSSISSSSNEDTPPGPTERTTLVDPPPRAIVQQTQSGVQTQTQTTVVDNGGLDDDDDDEFDDDDIEDLDDDDCPERSGDSCCVSLLKFLLCLGVSGLLLCCPVLARVRYVTAKHSLSPADLCRLGRTASSGGGSQDGEGGDGDLSALSRFDRVLIRMTLIGLGGKDSTGNNGANNRDLPDSGPGGNHPHRHGPNCAARCRRGQRPECGRTQGQTSAQGRSEQPPPPPPEEGCECFICCDEITDADPAASRDFRCANDGEQQNLHTARAHARCLNMWVRDHGDQCPLCRGGLTRVGGTPSQGRPTRAEQQEFRRNIAERRRDGGWWGGAGGDGDLLWWALYGPDVADLMGDAACAVGDGVAYAGSEVGGAVLSGVGDVGSAIGGAMGNMGSAFTSDVGATINFLDGFF